MASAADSSSVSFPTTEPNHASVRVHLRQTYLPFRRISLPSPPSAQHRQSVASMASFDSLVEEGSRNPPSANKFSRLASRPSSSELPRKTNRRRPFNDVNWAKRQHIVKEFYETERSYVDGLDLIYSHFLTPIIDSLESPNQLLDRTELTSVFSNFVDIWNLHRSFFSSLSAHLQMLPLTNNDEHPSLSSILLAHFPYLSLYNPFVSSFDTAQSSYAALLSSKPDFASFISAQEADPKCSRLKLRDWLLTVVQRCPRYLLLLKDLIACTDLEDPEHARLTSVHTLVSKITLSLNTSLHTHAQTLSLLAIQRSTPNLPFALISPGRTLLKRGTLLQVEGSTPREREFLLFSDCIMWLSSGDKMSSELFGEKWPNNSSPSRSSVITTRSKSDAELSQLADYGTPSPLRLKSKSNLSPVKKQRHASSGSSDERWQYKGHINLVDVEMVSPPVDSGEQNRLEFLSPQISFAVYAESEDDRNEWAEAIRDAKESLLVSLNAINPNSTLTSSSSTNHLRRTLQASPHLPEDANVKPKRGKVEHFMPAIWVPDNKTDGCMRCGRSFGWRRRRHHCRLCGRCVCARCSEKTFFVSDSNKDEESHKPARACDTCYETVFPLIDTSPIETSAADAQKNAVPTLSFPSWKSVRLSASKTFESALPPSAPSLLMAIDLNSPKRELTKIEDEADEGGNEHRGASSSRVRIRSVSRPKSYHQILEDFEERDLEELKPSDNYRGLASGAFGSLPTSLDLLESSDEVDSHTGARLQKQKGVTSPPSSFKISPSPRRKEDTARRRKRFSMPALALQTTPVTTRPSVSGEGKSQRFSLILGSGVSSGPTTTKHVNVNSSYGAAASKLSELLEKDQGR